MLRKLPYFILGGVIVIGTIFLLAIWIVTISYPESSRLQLAREDQIINDLIFYGQLRQVTAVTGMLLLGLLSTIIVLAISRRILAWSRRGSYEILRQQQYRQLVTLPKTAMLPAPFHEKVSSWVIPEEVEVL